MASNVSYAFLSAMVTLVHQLFCIYQFDSGTIPYFSCFVWDLERRVYDPFAARRFAIELHHYQYTDLQSIPFYD